MYNNNIMLNHIPILKNDLFFIESFQQKEIINEVYMTFAKKSSAESKFVYTYDILKKHNKLPTKCLMINEKNNKKASKIRAQGNVQFQNKNYASALSEYNKSVMIAKNDSQDYALALANRSAALYYLEEYNACICDIHHALSAKYPNELTYKLYERELKCLEKMGKISEANLKFKDFLSHLAQSSLSKGNRKSLEVKIKKLLNQSNKKKNNDYLDKTNVIKLFGSSNKNIPSLSKFVKIKYSESMGRCLVVTSDIDSGDVLIIEKPYAAVLKSDSFEYNCRYCFKHCFSGIPCLKCTWAIYCNEDCRVKSYESGHKYECKILATFYSWPCMDHMEHLSLYIFLTAICEFGLDKYIATVRALNTDTTDPIMRGFNSSRKYLSNQFCSAYTLEGNETKRTVSDLFIRNCYAAVLVSLIKLTGLEIPDHQLGVVGESLVHIICAVSSNAHEMTQSSEHKIWCLSEKHKCLPIASALLPVLSLLNHHCDPNVVRHNYNGTIVLRAIQPITKGSQLFDNYGKAYATHSKSVRHEMLSSQYHFHCECKPCEEDWPMYNVLSKQPQSECIVITNINLDLFKTQSVQLYKIISEIKTKKSDGLCYIKFLFSHLAFLHNNIKKPYVEYCDCQETIKEIFFITTDKFIIEDSNCNSIELL
ncbi:Zinc finger, MYND-type,Tetratricopeptide-like helical domain,SET domain [Cinara cedri]|uniref:Protein-lysine N-methyltransferase SMYD4 n=1 Tax=Cinara cedri TaxID=506608 RepID=A0A5E4N098_9HEMI|nr:Zinc finger, MYND-type,Tetratricopeptide-like helical domain,SET domain [Cinara cedri]